MQNQTPLQETIKTIIELIGKEENLPKSVTIFFSNLFDDPQKTKQSIFSNWNPILNLSLTALQKHPSTYLQLVHTPTQSFLSKLLQSLLSFAPSQQLYDWIISKLSADIQISSQFFLLRILIRVTLNPTVKVIWQRALPLILKTAGLILQKYLKIREEKASSSTDRIAADLIIENHSEQWIEALFLMALEQYSKLLQKDNILRRYFINFGCDLELALLQSFLMSSLNKQVLTTLMLQFSRLFIRQYSAIELINAFNQTLKHTGMITSVKNLEVVDIYQPQSLIDPTGLSYIVKNIISEPHSKFILSQFAILKSIIPILSESMKRQFPFKHDILELAETVITSSKLKVVSDDQFDYPVALLVANLVASKENESEYTNIKTDAVLAKVVEWKYSLVKCLDFSNSVYVKKFVLQKMNINNSYEYSILSSLNPIDSEKQFTEAYIQTLIKLQSKKEEYRWLSVLLQQKLKHKIIQERLKQ